MKRKRTRRGSIAGRRLRTGTGKDRRTKRGLPPIRRTERRWTSMRCGPERNSGSGMHISSRHLSRSRFRTIPIPSLSRAWSCSRKPPRRTISPCSSQRCFSRIPLSKIRLGEWPDFLPRRRLERHGLPSGTSPRCLWGRPGWLFRRTPYRSLLPSPGIPY